MRSVNDERSLRHMQGLLDAFNVLKNKSKNNTDAEVGEGSSSNPPEEHDEFEGSLMSDLLIMSDLSTGRNRFGTFDKIARMQNA